MKNKWKERQGFTLVIVLIGLALVSILGVSIIGVTTSTFKMTKIDSIGQSAYYIAEAGINKIIGDITREVDKLSEQTLSHDQFFEKLDNYIDENLELAINDFEESSGERPLARITINDRQIIKEESSETDNLRVVGYNISSNGEIGNSQRKVATYIEIAHGIKFDENIGHHPAFDYVMYNGGNKLFNYAGGSNIDGSVYARNIKFEATNTIMNGSIISEKSVELISAMKINGDVYAMDGKVNLSNSNIEMKGNIHATDTVTLSHGTTLDGNIYTNGEVELKSSNVGVIGDIHSRGNIKLGSTSKAKSVFTNGNVDFVSNGAIIDGELHANGDIYFGSGTNVKDIYTGGNIEFSSNNTINGDINSAGYVGRFDKGNDVRINGNIISGNDVITRSNNGYNVYGNIKAVGKVENGTGNYISGNVLSNKAIVNLGKIEGTIKKNSDLIQPKQPITPKKPDFRKYENIDEKVPLETYEIGTSNIQVDNNSTKHSVLPGYYNNLILKWNDTAKFTSGSYYFNSFDASESAIKLKLDVSKGPINIYAKENIKFGSGLEVYVSENGIDYIKLDDNFIKNNKALAIELAGKIYWETYNDFILAENCYFLGTIVADNNIISKSSVKLVGAYIVNNGNISMGYGPKVIYAPPTKSAAGSSGDNNDIGDSNSLNDRGQNSISSGSRLKMASSIREK